MIDPVYAGADQKGKGQIGIGLGVGGTQFNASAAGGVCRDPDELAAVLDRPADVARRFHPTQSGIGLFTGIEEECDIPDVLHDSRHEGICMVTVVLAVDGNIKMHAITGFSGERFWRKIRCTAVRRTDAADRPFDC